MYIFSLNYTFDSDEKKCLKFRSFDLSIIQFAFLLSHSVSIDELVSAFYFYDPKALQHKIYNLQ